MTRALARDSGEKRGWRSEGVVSPALWRNTRGGRGTTLPYFVPLVGRIVSLEFSSTPSHALIFRPERRTVRRRVGTLTTNRSFPPCFPSRNFAHRLKLVWRNLTEVWKRDWREKGFPRNSVRVTRADTGIPNKNEKEAVGVVQTLDGIYSLVPFLASVCVSCVDR